MNTPHLTTILPFVVLLILFTGCSTLNENHPTLDEQKCDVCHLFPPNDTAEDLDTLESTLGVHAKFAHADYVSPDTPNCGVCHHTFDKTSKTWNIPQEHWNGNMKFSKNSVLSDTMNTCYRCHRYSDCNTCHLSPPENTHPLRDTIHKVHVTDTTNVTDEKFGCYVCHKGNDHSKKIVQPYGGTHDNLVTDVEFDIRLKNGTLTPPIKALKPARFNKDLGTCENIYCHGNTIAGGKESIAMNAVIPSTAPGRCNACHENTALLAQIPLHAQKGTPQKPGHAENFKDCQNCHLGYSVQYNLATKNIHINGIIDLAGCEKCHTDKIPLPFGLVNGKIIRIQP